MNNAFEQLFKQSNSKNKNKKNMPKHKLEQQSSPHNLFNSNQITTYSNLVRTTYAHHITPIQMVWTEKKNRKEKKNVKKPTLRARLSHICPCGNTWSRTLLSLVVCCTHKLPKPNICIRFHVCACACLLTKLTTRQLITTTNRQRRGRSQRRRRSRKKNYLQIKKCVH